MSKIVCVNYAHFPKSRHINYIVAIAYSYCHCIYVNIVASYVLYFCLRIVAVTFLQQGSIFNLIKSWPALYSKQQLKESMQVFLFRVSILTVSYLVGGGSMVRPTSG